MSEPKRDAAEEREGSARRRRLWEIPQSYHCSILGTCLTLTERRRIIRRTRLSIPEASTEYEIHATFVCLAGRPDSIAKVVQKHQDRKCRKAVLQ